MMEIDEALKTQYGTERPFTVPDAYFDRVEEVVMRSVAADAEPPWCASFASLCGSSCRPLWQPLAWWA